MFAEPSRLLLRCVLVLSLIKAINCRHQQQLRRVCYFTNWSCDLLVKEAYFCLRDLDPSLCSHIIFAFAGVNVTSLSLSPIRVDDESVGNVKGRYVQFNDIKKTHPDVKTLLSAGGSYQAERFKIVTASNGSRERFAYNTARYVRQWGFDGLDLDWEYPGKMEKEALTHLVKDLKSAFREEAVRTGRQELLLSIAVPVGEERVRLGYQVDLISKDADMINLMAYDFYYGAWTLTAFNSPLYPRNHHTFSRKHSVEWIVNLWINLGAPPHKINLGIAGYGQSFTLQVDRQETLPSVIQTDNSSSSEPDPTNQNTASVLRNASAVNETLTTFYNNVSDYEKDNIQSLLSNNDSVQNTQICNGNMEICTMKARLSQNISRIKRDGNGIFSHDQPATSSPSDILNSSSNSDPAGFGDNNSDEISIHENGIGTQELDSKGTEGLGTDIEMPSHGEDVLHSSGISKHKHANSALPTRNGSQQTDTHTGVYGGNSQPQHGTDGVVYGGNSQPRHGTDGVIYGGNSQPQHGTDGVVYGGNSQPQHGTDGVIYGGNSQPQHGTDGVVYGGNSQPQHGTDGVVYGGNSQPQHGTDGVIYGGNSQPQHGTDGVVYGGNSQPQHGTDGVVYGGNSQPQHGTDGVVYGGNSQPQHGTDGVVYGGNSQPQHGTDGVVYGGNSQPRHGTDGVVYGGNSQPQHGTDGVVYGGNSQPQHGTDGVVYGGNSQPQHGTDGVVYGGNSQPQHGTDGVVYGGNSQPQHGTDGVIYGGNSQPQHGTDGVVYGGNSQPQHGTDGGVYGGNSQAQHGTDGVVYGGNSQPRHGTDDGVYGVGSKAVGPGRPGRLRHLKGQLSYPEICEKIHAGAKVAWDQEQRAPYAILGDQWVGYENTRSVAEKVTWAFEHRLGGVMFWSLDLDDFKGDYCGEGRFPLLTSMSKTVISLASQGNRSITGNTRDFTNEIPQVELTEAVTTQKSTPVTDNIMKNATERSVTTVTLINKQITRTRQIVTTTAHLPRQNAHRHFSPYNITSFDNISDLAEEMGPTDDIRFTNKRIVNILTPASAGNSSEITTKKFAIHKANIKDSVTPTSLFLPHGRKQSEPDGISPSYKKNQPESNDLFPSQEKKQPQPNDFFPSKKSNKPERTDFFSSQENKQSEPTNIFLSNETKQSESIDYYPSVKNPQSEPANVFTSGVREESETSNNEYDYGADSIPASTVATEATTTTTTTTHKSKTDKQKKSHRKPGTKKRLYRNASCNVTASINAVVCVICALLINAILVCYN